MTIGSLAVNITATTDKFAKGLQSARGMLSKFTGGITAAQGIVAGFVTYGLKSIVDGAIEAGSALFEMTQKTHVSAEALSALHFAAEQLESSAGVVDSAIQFMTKTLGKAAEGADPAIKAFNALNIDFEKLQGLSVDKQFLSIVDALHKIPDPAERAAAAQGIFGRGSKELAALLEAGTDQIIKMGQEAANTGAIISSETAAALDEAGDAAKRFSTSWDALKVQMVGTFAPAITFAMDAFVFAIKVAKVAWFGFESAISVGLAAILKLFDLFIAAWNKVVPAFAEFDRQQSQSAVASMMGVAEEYNQKAAGVFGTADNPLAKSAADISGHVTTGAEERAASKVEKEAAKQSAKDKKEEEKKIAALAKKQTEQLDQLIGQGSKRGPVLQVVGVR